jgi:hypothetical protein
MKRLAYLLPSAFLGFAVTGCGDDGIVPGADTEEGGDTEDDDDSGDPTTVGMTTMSSSVSNSGDPTSDTDTMGDSSSSTGGGDNCSMDDGDECEEDNDCPTPGATCVACNCVGGTGDDDCEEWGADSGYEDCSEGQGCPAGSTCLNDPTPGGGAVCTIVDNCRDRCDCPQPPKGFEDQVQCDPLRNMDVEGDCYINCEGGAECPEGMYCALGRICAGGDGPPTLPPYGDCFNNDKACDDGAICFPSDDYGFCTDLDCMDDCPDHGDPDATAVPTCETLLNNGMMDIDACYLDCSGGETCPDGMVCQELFAGAPDGCVWVDIDNTGYGDCVNLDEADECLGDPAESCITAGTDPEEGVCASTDCSDPAEDCALPASGDAEPACVDVDGAGGDECVLDCTGGEACPDGMVCGTSMYCVWVDGEYCDAVADPSFELGMDDWAQDSTNFGSPLCDEGLCGSFHAVHGDWYVWFGGLDMSAMGAVFPEVGSVEQDVTIPASATNLRFMIDFGVVTDTNPEDDYVRVLVDDTELWIATGEDADLFTPYGEVLIDLTAGGYNDDGVHTITIESSIEGDEITSIWVDDVFIVCDG